MTKAQLIKEICKREGKKSNVKIGDVREIISILSDIILEEILSGKAFAYINSVTEFLLEDADRKYRSKIKKDKTKKRK